MRFRLEPELENIVLQLVDTARSVDRLKRDQFFVFGPFVGETHVRISTPNGGEIDLLESEVARLSDLAFIRMLNVSRDASQFSVTPDAYAFADEVAGARDDSVSAVEGTITRFLQWPQVREHHPRSIAKWSAANELLRSPDPESTLTQLGHLCREALQEFANELIQEYQPPDADQDKAHDVNRIKAVLRHRSTVLSAAERRALDALADYWSAVSALAQRQEHGAQREGEPLSLEDGRRLIFLAAIVMYEVHRSLSRSQ